MKLSGLNEEVLRLKFRNHVYLPATRAHRRRQLRVDDFTIISNNCWGGTVYESYGIKKLSPTVGMFIMPEDYLKLATDLPGYLAQPLTFIDPEQSRWRDALRGRKNWGTYPVARLGDIELHMLHYRDPETARRKWESRVARVNPARLIYKFNDQNGATAEHIRRFMNLPLAHRLCFVSKPELRAVPGTVFVRQPARYAEGVMASREPLGRSRAMDVTAYINSLAER